MVMFGGESRTRKGDDVAWQLRYGVKLLCYHTAAFFYWSYFTPKVEGLNLSLQSKQQENSFLQLRLSEAQQSLDLIQASWQGDLADVQVSGLDSQHVV